MNYSRSRSNSFVQKNSQLNLTNITSNTNRNRIANQQQLTQLMHPETKEFVFKYFPLFFDQSIKSEEFVDCIMEHYSQLWTQDQTEHAFKIINQKLKDMMVDKGYINVQLLAKITKGEGIIGMILQIFRMKNEQEMGQTSPYQLENLKNILLQFVEGICKKFQQQIYNKFNTEMRRMVLKYKETEKLTKKLNKMINQNIDVVRSEYKIKQLKEKHEQLVSTLKQQLRQYELVIHKQQIVHENLYLQIERLSNQKEKLSSLVERFQNTMLMNYNNNTFSSPIQRGTTPVRHKGNNLASFFQQKKPKNDYQRSFKFNDKQNLKDFGNIKMAQYRIN